MSIKIGQTTVTQSNISNGNRNQNPANVIVSTIFDWIGTLAEYTTQNVEVLHPDWVCYITDDVAGGESVYTKAQCDAKYATKSLSNIPANYDYVVESQLPTADNNYTWYRKYKSGWIEQGGVNSWTAVNSKTVTITLPVEMADTNYTALAIPKSTRSSTANWTFQVCFSPKTSTTVLFSAYSSNTADLSTGMSWEVKGMAA